MDKYKSILVNPQTTISKTLEIIDHSALQIALVVDEASRLVGTVTDGDVRRGLLKGVSLQEPIEAIMNRSPTVCSSDQSRKEILAQMKSLKLRHIPIVDSQRRVVALEILEQLIESLKRDNWVVLMAGGLGQRLRPLTNDIPKPLLQVGNKPLLETTLEGFIEQGFRQFYISVNYKAKMIEEYFGNGSKWGIEIKY
jgi:CBS-domain-containing membrane protein